MLFTIHNTSTLSPSSWRVEGRAGTNESLFPVLRSTRVSPFVRTDASILRLPLWAVAFRNPWRESAHAEPTTSVGNTCQLLRAQELHLVLRAVLSALPSHHAARHADSMHDIGFGRGHYRNKELETRLTRSARGLRVCGVEVTLAPHAHACTPRGQLPGGNQNKVATAWKAQDKKDTCKEAMAAAIDASCCLTLAGPFAGCCSCSTAPPCRSSLTIRPPPWDSND